MFLIKKLITIITSFILAAAPLPKYTEGVIGQPESFFPGVASTHSDQTVSRLIYKGLFKYDIYGVLVPDLVETWSVSENGTVYTIKLKDNQYWTDGTKITSEDLIYTAFNVPDLAGVATDHVDELTVRYTLPNKYSPFLSLLTVGVVQNNALENQNGLKPVSSGDFRVLRVEKRGEQIYKVVLLHKDRQSSIRKIVFRYYSNEDELRTAAGLGEIDAFLSDHKYEIENFTQHKFPLQGIYYSLMFNLREEKMQDLEMRASLEKVLPIESLTYQEGILVEGPISRSLFTDDSLEFDKYDEEYSESLGELILELTTPDIPRHVDMAEKIKEIWEDKLDIDVELRIVPPDDMLNRVINPRNFEVLLYGQEVGRDPDRYVYWHSVQKDTPGLNLTGFEQVRADRALEEGRNEPDFDARITHYNEFQKVVLEEVPAIFLYHPFVNYYVSNYIEGLGEKYTFTYSDRFLDFENWKRVRTN
jgi:peptide/nickel transport system substrate-binding protein